jgi:steroid 5-alpha reductase family enzyme
MVTDYFLLFSQTPNDEYLLQIVLYFAGCLSIFIFFLNIITGNYSQVDRLWSLLPGFYNIFYLLFPVIFYNESFSDKQILSTTLIVLWSSRLTFNYARKGGYSSGSEDYRWEYLRKNYLTNKFLYQIFNLTFICVYQNYLILLFSMPGYIVYLNRNSDIKIQEIVVAGLFITFLVIETVADQQQWNFQTEKYRLLKSNKLESPYKEGFIQTGLFKYSRHPNFFGEIMLWWSFYFFSCVCDRSLINFTIIGVILLNLLFLGSTPLTEKISTEKYPLYVDYTKRVSRIIPWFSSKSKVN